MLSKGILVIGIILLLMSVVEAQQGGDGFSVVTNPNGAEIILVGDNTVAGVSPVNFRQVPEGSYKVSIQKQGYETYKTSLFLQPGIPRSLNVSLKQKTRFKSFTRSFFIPGWGQSYTDQKSKGRIFMLMTLGAVAAYLIADGSYDEKGDLYDDYLDRYNAMSSFAEKEQFYPELAEARKDAYDSETVRRVTIGVTIGVWGLNLLDALFQFPDYGIQSAGGAVTLVPDLEQGGGKLILSHRF